MLKKIIITIAALFVIGAAGLGVWSFSESNGAYYYTRIDNSQIEQADSRGGVIDPDGGMPYSYTLPSYDESGAEKDIEFGASRELKEGAFLRLTVMPIRGVTEWSEVQYDELPQTVQKNYAALADEE